MSEPAETVTPIEGGTPPAAPLPQPTQQPAQGGGDPPAGPQGQSIPLHRFNEVVAKLRTAEGNSQLKDEMIQQLSGQITPQQQVAAGTTAEDLGLDQETFTAFQKVVELEVGKREQSLKGMISQLANQQDETNFLREFGQEKAAWIPMVRQYQIEHHTRTGVPVDMKHAYLMVQYQQSSAQTPPGTVQPPAAPAAPAQPGAPVMPPAAPAQPSQFPVPTAPSAPPPAGTQVTTNAGVPPNQQKPFEEMTVEEQEAYLGGQVAQGATI